MHLKLSSTTSIPSHVMTQHLEDSIVLLNIISGEYHSLDAIGADIWQKLSSGYSIERTINELQHEYEADRSVIETDVSNLIEQLTMAKLIEMT